VKDALLARGSNAVLIDDDLITESAIPSVVRALELAGAIAISARNIPQAVLAEIRAFAGVLYAEEQHDVETILNAITGTR
jgi:bifunctional enzyme CysN/CysC/sulfate adenylyltransferase subunit 1